MCGAGPSCTGNTAADSCDAANSQCTCGGAATCTLAEETCSMGA